MKNSSNINAATNQQFTATVAAGYKVVVTKNNGCAKTSPEVNVTKSCKLSSEVPDAGAISIYPNPSSGKFILRFNNEESQTATIEVLNSLGQLIMIEKAKAENSVFLKEVSFNNATPDGIYFIRVTLAERIYSAQIILQQ